MAAEILELSGKMNLLNLNWPSVGEGQLLQEEEKRLKTSERDKLYSQRCLHGLSATNECVSRAEVTESVGQD